MGLCNFIYKGSYCKKNRNKHKFCEPFTPLTNSVNTLYP